MAKAERSGKVLIDWSQNDEHKTTVNVYSLRAKERPTVSTPVDWEEVEACRDQARSGSARLRRRAGAWRASPSAATCSPRSARCQQVLPAFGG